MNTSQATVSNEPTASAPVFDNPIAARALEWAREWYPGSQYAVTGVTNTEASVLVEVDGDIRILRYENLEWPGPLQRCHLRPLDFVDVSVS